jgi:enoyl-CoA hydratase/carnithine racemase
MDTVISTVTCAYPRPGVALLTIDRPHRHNAIDPDTNDAMARWLAELDGNAQVRCIVITGAGDRAFCAGADIGALVPRLRADVEAGRHDPQICGMTHRNTTAKPMLAAINGLALGGGLELALACDLRIASWNARFGLPEIHLGLLAAAGGCTRLPRTIPAALAAEMILTGESIVAERALRAGLVSRVVAPDRLLGEALDLAEIVASRAPGAVRACTALLRRARFQELGDALEEERNAFAHLVLSEDGREGVRAFVDKREPVWRDS